MVNKETSKYWISTEELLKMFGFKENDLLMGIQVFRNMNNPLGYQIQGLDLYVEHSTEKNQKNIEEVIELANKNKGKKEIKKKAKGKK